MANHLTVEELASKLATSVEEIKSTIREHQIPCDRKAHPDRQARYCIGLVGPAQKLARKLTPA